MLRRRLITALVLIPLPLVVIWFGEPWLTALVAVFAILGTLEFYHLGTGAGMAPATYLGLVLTLLFILGANPELATSIDTGIDQDLQTPFLLTLTAVISLVWMLLRRNKDGALTGWAWTMAGVIYVGWFLSHWVSLRGLEDGRSWVFLGLLVTVVSDSAAFFTGRAFGHRRLAPRISPHKTWEGAIGGAIIAALFAMLFTVPAFFGWDNPACIQTLSLWQAALVGLLVSIFGQAGDLVESLLKRNTGAKDSGKLFPGHGGVLDRLDSILFAGVVLYYFVLLIG